MQIVVEVPCKDAREYVEQGMHQRVRPPACCPCCKRQGTLEAHDYYQRGCTDAEGHLWDIQVRRFECTACACVVSCLPDFAQPYRLIHNATIQKFFAGDRVSADVVRHHDTLSRYWRTFVAWTGRLKRLLGSTLGRGPPDEPAAGLWRRVLATYRSLGAATRCLVADFQTTCFGQYRCHQPAAQVG